MGLNKTDEFEVVAPLVFKRFNCIYVIVRGVEVRCDFLCKKKGGPEAAFIFKVLYSF